MADLSTISIEDLQRELNNRDKVEPLFEKDGVRYYDTRGYDKLLEKWDKMLKENNGNMPVDYEPVEVSKSGTALNTNAHDVCINVGTYFSNRVKVAEDGKTYHVVTDTRTIQEADSGNVTIAFVPEYVVTKSGKTYTIERGTVSRADFLKDYNQSFGIQDMLKIMKIADENSAKLNGATNTISLG